MARSDGMKTILMSIHPKWCHKIFTGEKTIELRKTAPAPPFRVVVYCTKPSKKHQTICGCMVLNSDELFRLPDGTLKYGDSIVMMCYDDYTKDNFLNGKVIGEFICDKVERIFCETVGTYNGEFAVSNVRKMAEKACLTTQELHDYMGDKDCVLGLHITAPKLYDKPIEMTKRPPQSWQYIKREDINDGRT